MSYPNWKLGEKKNIKEFEPQLNQAINDVKSKLGSEWTIEVDWETIGKLTEGSSYRENAGKNVVENFVVLLVTNDVSKFDADDSAALNKLAGVGAKKIVVSMSPAGGTFKFNSRMNIDITPGVVSIKWAADWFGYPHGEEYLRKLVLNTADAAAMPPFPGQWTLAEIKSVQAVQAELDEALHKLRAKLGNDWSIDIDWASIATHTKDSSYRSDVGKNVIKELVVNFVSNDVEKMDGDVSEALNDAVGSTKTVKFAFGSKSDSYDINSRLKLKVDKTAGVQCTWSGDWFGYPWGEDYLNKWSLKNF